MRRVVLLVVLCACGSPAPSLDGGTSPRPDASVEPFVLPDAKEAMPRADRIAGALTLTQYGTRPFLSPATVDEVLQSGFSLGREFFVADWVIAPNAARPNLDGLGPLLHAESCVACHPATGRPASLNDDGTVDVGVLFRLRGPMGGDPLFGGQLQPRAILGARAEARITFTQQSRRAPPRFHFETDGALDPATRALPRSSPHLAGMGLLEAVPDATLLAMEDPDDLDGDGVSGRAARLPGDGGIGRFGWKAVHATLAGQSAAAFAGDMGITSPGHPDDCTPGQGACRALPQGGLPELRAVDVEAVSVFMRFLGVPAARRSDDDPLVRRGHAVFEYAGCVACHRSTLQTGASSDVLDEVTFHPYTDLLLHDLGPELADADGEGVATAREWRTPPLWGLGLVAEDPKARFLHDARAATFEDAIRWHGGEAHESRNRFEALRPEDQAALLAFLRSL